MKNFGKWLARHFLRPTDSRLWWYSGAVCGAMFAYFGWWAILALFVSILPITLLEVWWNEYADDYDDLEEDA